MTHQPLADIGNIRLPVLFRHWVLLLLLIRLDEWLDHQLELVVRGRHLLALEIEHL